MSQPRNGTTPGDVEEIHWPSLVAAVSSISAVGIAIGLGLPLLSIILEKRGIPSTLIGLNTAMAGVAGDGGRTDHHEAGALIRCRSDHDLGRGDFGDQRARLLLRRDFWMWFPLRSPFTAPQRRCSSFRSSGSTPPRPPSEARLRARHLCHCPLVRASAGGPLLFSVLGSDGLLPFAVRCRRRSLLAAIPIYIARYESPVLEEKPELHFMRYVFLVPTATAAVFIFGARRSGRPGAVSDLCGARVLHGDRRQPLLLTVMGIGNMIFQIPVGLLFGPHEATSGRCWPPWPSWA